MKLSAPPPEYVSRPSEREQIAKLRASVANLHAKLKECSDALAAKEQAEVDAVNSVLRFFMQQRGVAKGDECPDCRGLGVDTEASKASSSPVRCDACHGSGSKTYHWPAMMQDNPMLKWVAKMEHVREGTLVTRKMVSQKLTSPQPVIEPEDIVGDFEFSDSLVWAINNSKKGDD